LPISSDLSVFNPLLDLYEKATGFNESECGIAPDCGAPINDGHALKGSYRG
jgi:hypothetical protein